MTNETTTKNARNPFQPSLQLKINLFSDFQGITFSDELAGEGFDEMRSIYALREGMMPYYVTSYHEASEITEILNIFYNGVAFLQNSKEA